MKKTLLALAALTAASASFAQSSVTLYGVVDASVESVKGDKTVTRVSSDNLSTSRIGVKGSEDLGGGLKANFNLESGLKTDTGTAGDTAGRFWNRASWVGLAGGFGDLRLGRIDSAIGDIAGNVLSAQPYDDLVIVGTRAGVNYRRVDNAITYFLPSMVPGLTASLQYSTGTGAPATAGEVAGSSEGKAYGLSVKYAAGPLSAGIGYLNAKDESTGAAVTDKANATLGYIGYDFGAAKVTAYYDAETGPVLGTTGERRLTVAGAKVAVPFTPEFTLIVGGSTARNVNGSQAGDDNVQITTIKGIYNLSKRTSAYAMVTNVNNDTGTVKGIIAPTTADRNTHGIAVGVRHTF
jgi:predicted porin